MVAIRPPPRYRLGTNAKYRRRTVPLAEVPGACGVTVDAVEGPVEAQVQAYNAQDIDAFVGCYARDAVITDGEGNVICRGSQALRSTYGAMFAKYPGQRAEILDRVTAGNWTVDRELVHRDGRVLEVLVAYRTQDGLIDRVTMLR